ncbi:hypothetical protein ACKKBF_B35200 [Auxenochlorella protothecoides x Auxenochlorella symbiontica]|uniref:Matrin-type domain-containing protein n=1 Tax=Auxenochlorella protothecoides TaxID=3075 RepID=A0A1D1ZTI9_AUXPR
MSFMDAREHGSKPGSGAVSANQEAVDRRERLRRLALETIDLAKDPYYFRNHLGQIECRLCHTLHTNEGNYLAHTQGKRHQQNLAKRAAREAAEQEIAPAPQRRVAIRKTVKIGRPGYRVTKEFDPELGARALLFQIEYPEIEEGFKPRHRFMSSYEQRKEPWDKHYQYLLFAAEPYEVIAFKVPTLEVDRHQTDRLFSHWDPDSKIYSFQVPFKPQDASGQVQQQPPQQQQAPQPYGHLPPFPPRPPMGGMPGFFPPRPPPVGFRGFPPPPPGGMGFPPPPARMV